MNTNVMLVHQCLTAMSLKCGEVFRTKADVYSHANKCSEPIPRQMCEKCNQELVSKAELKKHTEKCHGNKGQAKKSSTEECYNGIECRFLKMNRCHHIHKEQQPYKRQNLRSQPASKNREEQAWTTVQRSKKAVWTCQV